MKGYIVRITADGGLTFGVEVRATNQSEALSTVMTMLSGKWVDLTDVNGNLNKLRTDRIINLTAILHYRENKGGLIKWRT